VNWLADKAVLAHLKAEFLITFALKGQTPGEIAASAPLTFPRLPRFFRTALAASLFGFHFCGLIRDVAASEVSLQ